MSDPSRARSEPTADGVWPGAHGGAGSGARVWLVRHPEVSAEWRGRAYGDLDVPLSPESRADLPRLADALAATAPREVVSSPLSRALELARALADAAGVPLSVEPGLAEIHRGAWQGRPAAELPPDEVAAFYADPWSWRASGAESDADVLARAWPVLAAASARAAGSTVVLVAHYNVIRTLCARALGVEPARSFALRLDPGRSVLLVDAAAEPRGGRTEAPPVAGWLLRHANVRDPREVLGARPGERAGAGSAPRC